MVYNCLDAPSSTGGALPELQRFVWEWSSLLERLRRLNPKLEDQIGRAARPIAAERRPDGRLLLVLGCWVPADRDQLGGVGSLQRIQDSLKTLLDERISVLVTDWLGGDGEPGDPPDPLGRLPESLRAVGLGAGSALNRAFFGASARRGIVFET